MYYDKDLLLIMKLEMDAVYFSRNLLFSLYYMLRNKKLGIYFFGEITLVYTSMVDKLEDANDYLDYVVDLLDTYEKLGPLPGILLPFSEAFLPFLPLFVFVLANGAAYGLFKGFLYSWIGSSIGSICVFLLIRHLGNKKFLQKIKKNRQVIRVMDFVERRGFGLLFILLCFPFSPSSIINVVAGLSNVRKQTFIIAVLLGKAVMVFSIAYIGSSIVEFAKHPVKTIIVVICITIFWIFGKYLEQKLTKFEQRKEEREGTK